MPLLLVVSQAMAPFDQVFGSIAQRPRSGDKAPQARDIDQAKAIAAQWKE
ncbi:hypothetical protein MHM84_20895 [Halomonas sp. McH1-25]|nr:MULTISPECIES: hypothetical protein [unclassified Halomonas]MCG7602196.1 hypothetical protein [Halomonas sp. McH1-25]MCP1344475.1 hypothetical protein [Halomonas sp. FL8]MCP1362796.1 hypothetical protein [Halomonas sp. BBD45]MCP1365844.1 hypothetical protein [Halomonas sp. BBD48]